MCTLSWQINDDRNSLWLVFNRDELFSRDEAFPPKIHTKNDLRWVAPIDPQGGGTWIAAREDGRVLCLLNDYMGKPRDQLGDKARSRGLLVRELIRYASHDEIRKLLNGDSVNVYQPFNLVLFDGVEPPVLWNWNGETLQFTDNPEMPLVSSGIEQNNVQKLRKSVIEKASKAFTNGVIPQDELIKIHQRAEPQPQPYSIAMRMKDRGTVSITSVRIDAVKSSHHPEISMTYLPGNPLISPGEAVKVSL